MLLIVSASAAGCDFGPSGPGAIEIRVSGRGLGGAVVEVAGAGIRSFEASGDTRAYWSAVDGSTDRYRVVAITESGGQVRFEAAVDDVRMEGPRVSVVSLVDTSNRPYPVGNVEVDVRR